MTIKLSPVKSSAPAITTSMSPTLNTAPAMNLVNPNPRVASEPTMIDNCAPNAMKAPARIARTKNFFMGILHLP
jgi:hypothetical protein